MIPTYFGLFVLSVNLVANIILIPKMGIKGAAIASTLSYTVPLILYIYLFKHFSKVKILDMLIVKISDINKYGELFRKLFKKRYK